jgi:nitrite reductase/ring-hydroxylating ferredoxin subunit
VFSLRSGEVVHGPATAPQPKFNTRVTDGSIEVMLEGAG